MARAAPQPRAASRAPASRPSTVSGSVQDAEDLVEEAMLRGWRARGRFRRDATTRTWLYRIATDAFLSSTRRRRHLPSDPDPPATDVSLDVALDQDTAWLDHARDLCDSLRRPGLAPQ